MKKNLIYLFIIFPIILISLYFCRWIISYKFDSKYWENFYYESQWNIPNSKRVIGDDGVYRYIGYRLVNGENPFNVDYWVPPLGKYLYGLGAKFLSNPLFVSILFYLILVLVVFLLSQELLNKDLILFSLIIFLLNPFVVSEIRTTMLDLPLTLMLTSSLLFFIKFIKYNKNLDYYLSILSLGLSIGIKPPFFVLAYVLIYGLFLLKKHQFKKIFIFPILVLGGYVMAYIPSYFIHHPNPIPWIRLHQKVYEFQKNNLGSHNWISIITYILYGRFMGYWVNAKAIYPSDYSLVFTIGSLSVFWVMFKNFISKRRDDVFIVFCSIGAVYILMLFLVDFWPRYLMPLIPIFSIVIPYLFQKRSISFILYLILFISLYISYKNTIIYPSRAKFEEEFYGYQQSNRLKEMYQMLNNQSKIYISEEDFLKNKSIKFNPINENNQWRMNIIK